jgi:hypothetical protein
VGNRNEVQVFWRLLIEQGNGADALSAIGLLEALPSASGVSSSLVGYFGPNGGG